MDTKTQGAATAASTVTPVSITETCMICGREVAGPGTHVLVSMAEVARRCFRNEEGAGSLHVNETCYRLGYERERADRFNLFLALRALILAVEDEANAARGISGNMGGRLSDARAALRTAGRIAVDAPKEPSL